MYRQHYRSAVPCESFWLRKDSIFNFYIVTVIYLAKKLSTMLLLGANPEVT